MFCMKCGAKLPEDAAFCSQCGNKVIAASVGKNESNNVEKKSIEINSGTEKNNDQNNDQNLKLSLLVDAIDKTDIFTKSSNIHVVGDIPKQTLNNAISKYAEKCDCDLSTIWLLCSDTFFADSGTVGFVLDNFGITTSREEHFLWNELTSIRLSDKKILVTKKRNPEYELEIYEIDVLDDDETVNLSDLFNAITDDLLN